MPTKHAMNFIYNNCSILRINSYSGDCTYRIDHEQITISRTLLLSLFIPITIGAIFSIVLKYIQRLMSIDLCTVIAI